MIRNVTQPILAEFVLNILAAMISIFWILGVMDCLKEVGLLWKLMVKKCCPTQVQMLSAQWKLESACRIIVVNRDFLGKTILKVTPHLVVYIKCS